MGNSLDDSLIEKPKQKIQLLEKKNQQDILNLLKKKQYKQVKPNDHIWDVKFNPPLPGRINIPMMGNCLIHASRIPTENDDGDVILFSDDDTTRYLVTLVDAVVDDGNVISDKKGKYYDVPRLELIHSQRVELVTLVKKMIYAVYYDSTNPETSIIQMCTYKDGDRQNQGQILTLQELLASKDPDDLIALENFKSDYPEWCDRVGFERLFTTQPL